MLDAYPIHGRIPELFEEVITIVGVTSSVAKVYGPGVTVTRTGTGAYLATWADNPGTFIGMTHGFFATTVADLKGFTVTAGVFNQTTFALAFTVTNASDAAADLAALQWLTLNVRFAQTLALPAVTYSLTA